MPWEGRGGGRGDDQTGAGFSALAAETGGAKPGSVPGEGRDPDAQSAGLGLETCCFGDHPDTWGDRNDYNGKPGSFTDPSTLFALMPGQRKGGKEKLPVE